MINNDCNIIRRAAGALATLACTMLLASCGGGGGSPGAVGGIGGTPAKAASVTLMVSSATMAASGADGTEVLVTAIVKDANNNALAGATVDFKADSGSISNTKRITDSRGEVTEKLSTKGDSSTRTITITASVGTIASAPKTVNVVATGSPLPQLLLTASSGVLQSSGTTDVTLLALVKDPNNAVVPNARVTFSADSGALSATQAFTDAKGIASVALGTGTDPTTRTINVTASIAGTPPSTLTVNVAGTKIAINASGTVNLGSSTDMTVTLTDSAGVPLANRSVAFSSVTNPIVTKGGAASPALTDAGGKLTLTYNAKTGTSDTVTVRALGETATTGMTINSSNFSVAVLGAVNGTVNINVCNAVAVSHFIGSVPQSGNVAVSSSRGAMFSDAGCSLPLGPATALSSGQAQVYVKSSGPGLATLTATSSLSGATTQGMIEFVAPLTAGATISLQADPAVVGTNVSGSTTEQVTLRAVVTDAASQGNLVKNARVTFSILTDPSGGYLTQPSEIITGSDGSATVSFVAGSTPTSIDGVRIQAKILSAVSSASATATLTVAKKSLFISAGTGAFIQVPTSSTYRVDYAVFVTDAAGNAVPGVSVTASVLPTDYRKGQMVFVGTDGPWTPLYVSPDDPAMNRPYAAICANEDLDHDGSLGPGEDVNGNGRLDPVIPLSISSSGKTDANGIALISMTYPRDRAFWLAVDFTIRGVVAGTEAKYVGHTLLPGLSTDYTDKSTVPPGRTSPYGTATECRIAN